jgi:hypothetical protein
MSHDPTPTWKRHRTETITLLREESRAVLIDAAALRAQSTVMLDEPRRLHAGSDLPELGRPDDGAGTRHIRRGRIKE